LTTCLETAPAEPMAPAPLAGPTPPVSKRSPVRKTELTKAIRAMRRSKAARMSRDRLEADARALAARLASEAARRDAIEACKFAVRKRKDVLWPSRHKVVLLPCPKVPHACPMKAPARVLPRARPSYVALPARPKPPETRVLAPDVGGPWALPPEAEPDSGSCTQSRRPAIVSDRPRLRWGLPMTMTATGVFGLLF